MKKLNLTFIMMLVGLFFFLSSCKKDNTNDTKTPEFTSTEDHALAENVFEDAFDVVDENVREDGSLMKNAEAESITGACAKITVDTSSKPYLMTIDFGKGCLGSNGRYRTGKILISFTGRYRQVGTVISISFDNYTVDGYKVEGTKTITNMGKNTKGNPYFTIVVKDAKISKNGDSITWQSSREREWTQGSNTPSIWDDEYFISGKAEGTNRKGVHYKADITKDLQVKIGCRWIESGTISIKPDNIAERIFDFGNGSCDNKATVTVDGKTYNINLN